MNEFLIRFRARRWSRSYKQKTVCVCVCIKLLGDIYLCGIGHNNTFLFRPLKEIIKILKHK